MRILKATLIIWYRELLRFARNPLRIAASLGMPFLWFVMFGLGIASSLRFSVAGPGTDFNYILFLFPGVLAVNVIFTAMSSAITTVRDREAGFLKEILVAPIPRSAIAIGKILGGATVASVQGILMIVLLPLAGLPLNWHLLSLFPYVFLFALMLTALAIMLSSRIATAEAFQMVINFLTFPMFMLSSALFPLRNLPAWMSVLSKINPASYGVDTIRHAAFTVYGVPDVITNGFGIVVFNTLLTETTDMNILLVLTALMIVVSSRIFAREDA